MSNKNTIDRNIHSLNINSMIKKLDSLPEAEEVKNIALKATSKYQKKYSFEMTSGKKSTHNNEADAFKHAYMQAYTRIFKGVIKSNIGGVVHEIHGNLNQGQPKNEENMDKWNNQVGQEIGKEISEQIKGMENMFKKEAIEDYIAHKVMQRMRAGDLILHSDDPRKFSDYHKIKAKKDELVPKYNANRNDFNNPASLLKYKRGYYKGFINDENGKDIIYTVENIGAMSDEEYNNNKKVLNAQIKKIGLPSNHDLRRPTSNGDVYVHSYTKGDGTYVTSHYRSRPN